MTLYFSGDLNQHFSGSGLAIERIKPLTEAMPTAYNQHFP